MSNESTPNPNLAHSPSLGGADDRQSHVESQANQLIDELFTDLEQQLLPSAPSSEEPLEMGEATVLSIDVWPPEPEMKQSPVSALAIADDEMLVSFSPLDVAGLQQTRADLAPWMPPPDPPVTLGNPDDAGFQGRLMLCVACTSVLSVVLLWIGGQFALRQRGVPVMAVAPQAQPAPALPELSPEEKLAQAQFADAMTRSQKRIQDLTDAAAKTKVTALTQSPTPLTAPTAGTTAPAPLAASATINNNAGQLPVAQPPAGQPAVPAPIAQANPLPVSPSPASTKPKAPSVTAADQTSTPANNGSVAAPTEPQAVEQDAPTVSLAKTTAPLTTVGKATQVLKGIVDDGLQSMVLVENNGGTRFVKLGEVLNSNGWTLVKIEGQEAIIQRGGQVRALAVGQKF